MRKPTPSHTHARHTSSNLRHRCFNTLQHTATHGNTLQHTSTCCNKLQHTATHCNKLQYTATHCNTLEHTATHCNTLQHTATHCSRSNLQCTDEYLQVLQRTATQCNTMEDTATLVHTCRYGNTLQHTATQCKTLQHNAAHCSTLQHTATHVETFRSCNTLQQTATHCNRLHPTAIIPKTRCNKLQRTHTHMGWLRFVGSLKSQVSFAEYRLFYRALLQKRPIILRSLLIVATPYISHDFGCQAFRGEISFTWAIARASLPRPSESATTVTSAKKPSKSSDVSGLSSISDTCSRAALTTSTRPSSTFNPSAALAVSPLSKTRDATPDLNGRHT